MNRLQFVLFIILWVCPLFGQEDTETLLSGKTEHGGYGGPHVTFSEVNGDLGIFTGAQGGWIINHTYVLGVATYNLQNEVNTSLPSRHLEMNYGGIQFTYIVHSDRLMHFSTQALLGTGNVRYSSVEPVDNEKTGNDWFWTLQPSANLELNVVKFFRVAFGLNYRYVNDIELPNVTNKDISGFGLTILLKFGKF